MPLVGIGVTVSGMLCGEDSVSLNSDKARLVLSYFGGSTAGRWVAVVGVWVQSVWAALEAGARGWAAGTPGSSLGRGTSWVPWAPSDHGSPSLRSTPVLVLKGLARPWRPPAPVWKSSEAHRSSSATAVGLVTTTQTLTAFGSPL